MSLSKADEVHLELGIILRLTTNQAYKGAAGVTSLALPLLF